MVTATLPDSRPADRQARLERRWACFDTWEDWLLFLDNWRPTSPCYVCTPEYQAEMIEQGRCEHPEVTFLCRGSQVIGLFPDEPQQMVRGDQRRELGPNTP